MKTYAKTEGYKWTDGNGMYFTEGVTPDDAPEYQLIPISEIPVDEDIDAEEFADIVLGVLD